MGVLKVTLGMVFLLLGQTQAQSSNCSYTRNVSPESVYYIYSPGYSGLYPQGSRCRWLATCPSNYNCRLDCPEIRIPESPSCSMDRLLISTTGDPQLASAEYYCGTGTLYGIVSVGQKISVGLISSQNSTGGRFMCELTAQKITTPTPTCSCGYKKTNRIVGGNPTKPNEYTMMAGVAYRGQPSFACGGVIITDQHILTAAHCVFGMPYTSLAVVVGEYDVNSGTDSPTGVTQGFAVDSYITHQQYNESNYDKDIAIVKIRGVINFSEYVGPTCLPFKYSTTTFAGATVTMLGWGTQFPGGPTANLLQMVNVTVTTQQQCQSVYPSLTPRQLCTYSPGKDACQYDSGGPVLYTDPTTGRLFSIGIISYGKSCASAGYPGINTRVTSFLTWIETYAPYNYCKI